MNKPQWTHEHGVLLESLRNRAGMDRATLARRNMLSVLQVEQLETGGDSGFYNADIKFSTGKKLLQFFGHTLQIKVKVAAEGASSISNTPSPPLEVPPQQAAAAKPAFKISGLGGALIVMTVLMAVFFLVQQSSNSVSKPSTEAAIQATQPEPKQEAVLATPSPAPFTAPSPAPVPVANADKQPLPALPEADKKEAPSKPQVLNAACAWEPTDTEIQPTSARKKGEYVHVVASDNVNLCIMDGNQRVASLSLTPGQERSIYGPGPFKVYSQQLPLVKIFFQGQAIKLPSPEIRQITLKPVALP
jgi:transcriptional regulator with XRE-family HTH domain